MREIKFTDAIKILTIPTIIMLFCLYGLVSISGTQNYEEEFCKRHVSSNLTDADYWLNYNGEDFPSSCCTEAGYGSYERDEGTMTRFIFGARGIYTKEHCVWVEDEIYKKPNIFTKIKYFDLEKLLP